MVDQADFEDLLIDPPSEEDLGRQPLGWGQRLVDGKRQILYLCGKAGCDGWELGDVLAYNGGDCTHSIMPANREEASNTNLLACRPTMVHSDSTTTCRDVTIKAVTQFSTPSGCDELGIKVFGKDQDLNSP